MTLTREVRRAGECVGGGDRVKTGRARHRSVTTTGSGRAPTIQYCSLSSLTSSFIHQRHTYTEIERERERETGTRETRRTGRNHPALLVSLHALSISTSRRIRPGPATTDDRTGTPPARSLARSVGRSPPQYWPTERDRGQTNQTRRKRLHERRSSITIWLECATMHVVLSTFCAKTLPRVRPSVRPSVTTPASSSLLVGQLMQPASLMHGTNTSTAGIVH